MWVVMRVRFSQGFSDTLEGQLPVFLQTLWDAGSRFADEQTGLLVFFLRSARGQKAALDENASEISHMIMPRVSGF